jgi:FlaA1/EpsC-like NDP-sugar epimerase
MKLAAYQRRGRRVNGTADPRFSVPAVPRTPAEPARQPAPARLLRTVAGYLSIRRAWILLIGHALLFALVYWLAFGLRFDFDIPPLAADTFWLSVLWVLGAKLAIFYLGRQYHGWWSYITFADLIALVRASALSLVVVTAIDHFVLPFQIPRSILFLDFLLTLACLGSLRASWRMIREQFWPVLNYKDCRWALLVGADHANGVLANQLHSHLKLSYRIKGFLSTQGEPRGSRLGNIPVLGPLEQVGELAASVGVKDILVTAGTLPSERLRGLLKTCHERGLNLKVIPPVESLFDGDHRIPLRDIEINDLLRRDPIELDTESIGALLRGRTVMITGAGGSIGAEICRQVLRFGPQELVLLGRGENRIFMLSQELAAMKSATRLSSCIADVTNPERMRQIFEQYRPEVVFHAAAHKHVPLMEANVGEAIRNNVGGTRVVADLADEFGVLSFVLVSTDKAVHPTSVMGVTKHLAERYVHALSQESSTRFVVTRFGNVLGSAGSVVPIFQEQIRRGGPITVTDPRMTRFFMTIPEASQLVLQAAAMGRGGEIFVLEMGEPIRIVDLARDLIRLSGLPEESIDIAFTGIRPGEKLFEELYFDDERTLPTSHPKLRAAYHRPYSLGEVRRTVDELEEMVHQPDHVLREKLQKLVPEYRPPAAAGRPEQTRVA